MGEGGSAESAASLRQRPQSWCDPSVEGREELNFLVCRQEGMQTGSIEQGSDEITQNVLNHKTLFILSALPV